MPGQAPASHPGFVSELRASPQPIAAALVAFACLCFWVADVSPLPSWWLPYVLVALLSALLAAIIWALAGPFPLASRWLAVASVAAVIFLGSVWVGLPGTLALLTIPTTLAAALISLSAAAVTTLVETALLSLLPGAFTDGLGATGVALIAIWVTLGLMYLIYRPVYRVSHWAWEFFRRTQGLLEEARDRKMELEQALQDLAQANLQLVRLNDLAQGLRRAADEARLAKEQFVANVAASTAIATPVILLFFFTQRTFVEGITVTGIKM